MITPRASTTSLQSRLQRARAAQSAGRTHETRRILIDVLREFSSREALELLADIEIEAGQLRRAEAALDRALDLAPHDGSLWSRRAALAALQGAWSAASHSYARAAALEPRAAPPLASLALAQLADERVIAAQTTCQRLVEFFSGHYLSYLTNAHVLKTLGNAEASLAAYEQTLQLNPESSEALFNITELRSYSPSSELALRMRTLFDREDWAAADRANVAFGLARIYERAQAFDDAFAWYQRANECRRRWLQRSGVVYDNDVTDRRITSVISEHGPDSWDGPRLPPSIPFRPIFIVGMPRSGTSLVEQILSCHSQVSAGGELTAAPQAYRTYRQLTAAGGDDDEALLEARGTYMETVLDRGLDRAFTTDKLPSNFELLGFIRRMFPAAHIVHCRRDPVATCWSLFCTNFTARMPYDTAISDIAHYYRLYQRLMAHWRAVLHPPMIEVQYEELVASPEACIRQLLNACGLDFEPLCIAPHESERPVTTASALQVRQPIYRSSVARWRNYERHLEALLALRADD